SSFHFRVLCKGARASREGAAISKLLRQAAVRRRAPISSAACRRSRAARDQMSRGASWTLANDAAGGRCLPREGIHSANRSLQVRSAGLWPGYGMSPRKRDVGVTGTSPMKMLVPVRALDHGAISEEADQPAAADVPYEAGATKVHKGAL